MLLLGRAARVKGTSSLPALLKSGAPGAAYVGVCARTVGARKIGQQGVLEGDLCTSDVIIAKPIGRMWGLMNIARMARLSCSECEERVLLYA
jgi:hypothetical protein